MLIGKTNGVSDRLEEGEAGRDRPPGCHDAGDPAPCPDPVERQIRRHAQQKIGDEEQAGAEAEHRIVQPQTCIHL
jgi:hypothetical protein